MKDFVNSNRVIVLFDEFGTPTLNAHRVIDAFLGVSVAYRIDDELQLFQHCDKKFGLSNRGPLKNDRISVSRAEEISELITQLPIQVRGSSIDLSNAELQEVVPVYEDLGNVLREKHRAEGPRSEAHILHDKIMNTALFDSITHYLETNQMNTDIDVFIDDWAIPKCDIDIKLELSSSSLQEKITELHRNFGSAINIKVSPIQLLNQDSKRKRFIDVVTSVISRAFFPQQHIRHSPVPLHNILTVSNNQFDDITADTIEFLRKAMDDITRNPPSLPESLFNKP